MCAGTSLGVQDRADNFGNGIFCDSFNDDLTTSKSCNEKLLVFSNTLWHLKYVSVLLVMFMSILTPRCFYMQIYICAFFSCYVLSKKKKKRLLS